MDVVGNIFKLFLIWIKLRSLYAVRMVEGMTVSGIVTFLIGLDPDMLFPGWHCKPKASIERHKPREQGGLRRVRGPLKLLKNYVPEKAYKTILKPSFSYFITLICS